MLTDIFFTVLFSISPFGESRVGIPYGILNGLSPYLAFICGLAANILVYPILLGLVNTLDRKMWRFRLYKQQTVKLSRRAKRLTGSTIEKYGFWGLMIFVMIPLPVTGAYMGAIAAILFKFPPKQAFYSISLGLLISCTIVTIGTYFGSIGIQLF